MPISTVYILKNIQQCHVEVVFSELYSRRVPQHNHNAQDFPHFSSKITKNNCLEKSPFVKKRRLHPQTSHLIHDYLITRRFSLHVSIVGLEMKKMGLRRISDCPYSSFRIIYLQF